MSEGPNGPLAGREWFRKGCGDGWKGTNHISYLYCTFPELEMGQEAPSTREPKALPLRTHDTSPSRKGLIRISGFDKTVTLSRPTPRIPLSLNLHKGLWSQNQLASSSPTPGEPLTVLHKICNMVSLLGLGLGVQQSSLNRAPTSCCSLQVPSPRALHGSALGRWKRLMRGTQVSRVKKLLPQPLCSP